MPIITRKPDMPAMNIKNPTARSPKRIQTMARRKSRARNGMPGLPKKRRSATRKRYIILFRCGGRGPLLRLDRLDKQGNRRQTSATFFAPRKKQFMVGVEQGKVPPQVCAALPYIQFEVSRVTKQLIHARRLLQKHCYLFFHHNLFPSVSKLRTK